MTVTTHPATDPRLTSIRVIDTDTHVLEPPDLWTARMSNRWGDLIPHVRWDETRRDEAWFICGERVKLAGGVAQPAHAGWHEYPPDSPPRWTDAPTTAWDASARLAMMDEYGIYAQVLFPNVALFNVEQFQQQPEFSLELVRTYNDWQTEWSAAAPERLLPMTMLPFWDLDTTLAEIERCTAMGHRGLVFTQDPGAFGLPVITDPHWDPMWASAQEKGLPINFHQATGDTSVLKNMTAHLAIGKHAAYTALGIEFPLANAKTIAWIICGGICHRYPDLNFVSVESGIGWLPFALETLDWQWHNCGVPQEHPELDLLPSEYFRRQIYGCFWFEAASARFAIEQLSDNIVYETDFPHPTSMSPGPATVAVTPPEYLSDTFGDLPDETLRKILHDNAARLYHLDT